MTDYTKLGAPMPASLGRCADLYRDVRDLRLAMQKEVEAVQAREAEIRDHIVRTLETSADTGAAGLRYRAQLVHKTAYRLKSADENSPEGGWKTFTAWVRANNRFDMLQKRLNEKAVADAYENGQPVPGLERMTIPDVSITKI